MDVDDLARRWQTTLVVEPSRDLDGAVADGAGDAGTLLGTYRPPLAATVRDAGETEGLATTVAASPLPGASAPAAGSPAGFRLLEEIGRGGMGVVHRAVQASLDREVAVKLLAPGRGSPEERARFLAEARTTGFLDHPNVVPVVDVGALGSGEPFLAMKLVGGTSWRRLLHPRTPAEHELARGYGLERHLSVLAAVGNAVAYAHEKGIVHRDLKPENVLVGAFGEVLVLDWGLALDLRAGDAPGPRRAPGRAAGACPSGTPAYMAPELAAGDAASLGPWTDTYLLGAILHEVVTGRPPHDAGSLAAAVRSAVASEPRSYAASVPAELQAILRRALAREPAARFPNVAELQSALARHLEHRQSLAISDAAARALERASAAEVGTEAERSARDAAFAEATAGYRQALVLWPGNEAAREGERRSRLEHGRAALAQGDVGVAESQAASLGPDPAGRELGAAARAAREEREKGVQRERRRERFLKIALAIGAVASTTAVVNQERARRAESEALQQQTDRFEALYRLEHSQRDAETARARAASELASRLLERAREARARGEASTEEALLARSLALDDRLATRERLLSARLRGPRLVGETPRATGGGAVAWSPDGAWLATASGGLVQLYDARTGEERDELATDGGEAVALAFAPDSKRLAVAGRSPAVAVLDLEARSVARELRGPESDAAGLAWSPDGRTVATVGEDGAARLWDPATGREARRLETGSRVASVAFAPDGRLVCALASGTVELREASTGGRLLELPGHEDAVLAVAVAAGGRRLASGDASGQVLVRALDGGARVAELDSQDEAVRAVVLSPDGERVAAVGSVGTARLWDVGSGRRLAKWNDLGETAAAAFSPDGARLAVVGTSGRARIVGRDGEPLLELGGSRWLDLVAASPADPERFAAALTGGADVRLWRGLERPEAEGELRAPRGGLASLAYSPDGKLLALGGCRGDVEVWDLAGRRVRRRVPAALAPDANPWSSPASSVAFSPDGASLAVAGGGPDLRVVALASGEVLSRLAPTGASPARSGRVAFGAGELVAFVANRDQGGDAAVLRVLGARGGAVALELRGHEGAVREVAASPSGRWLASCGQDRTVRVWELPAGRLAATWRCDEVAPERLAWSADERVLAAAGAGVVAWDTATGRRLLRVERDAGSAAPTADGLRVLVARRWGSCQVWEAAAEPLGRVLRGHAGLVTDVAWSPDGRAVASSATDGTVVLWDVATGGRSRVLAGGQPVRVSLGGDRVAVADAAGDEVRIHDRATGARLGSCAGGGQLALGGAAALSSDGRRLALADGSREAHVHELGPDGRPVATVALAPRHDRSGLARVGDVSWSADGLALATADDEGTLRLWRGSPLAVVATLPMDRGAYRAAPCALDAAGERLALGFGTELRTWSPGERHLVVLRGHEDDVARVAFDPSGRVLASGGLDGIRLWDLPHERERAFLEGEGPAIAWSPDGQRLAARTDETGVRLWDLAALDAFLARPAADLERESVARTGLRVAGSAVVLARRNRFLESPRGGR